MNEIVSYVQAVVDRSNAQVSEVARRVAHAQAEGFRIVSGGQTDDGWEVTDWRTDAVIVSGHGSHEEYEAAWDAHPEWYSFEQIDAEADEVTDVLAEPENDLPPGLAEALQGWAWEQLEEDPGELLSWLEESSQGRPRS